MVRYNFLYMYYTYTAESQECKTSFVFNQWPIGYRFMKLTDFINLKLQYIKPRPFCLNFQHLGSVLRFSPEVMTRIPGLKFLSRGSVHKINPEVKSRGSGMITVQLFNLQIQSRFITEGQSRDSVQRLSLELWSKDSAKVG